MKLPSKFQFRAIGREGFTNTAKVVGSTVEVKWARGYPEHLGKIPNTIFNMHEAESFAESGMWIVVDQLEAKQEDALADEFQFKYLGWIYDVKKLRKDSFSVKIDGVEIGPYTEDTFHTQVEMGRWKIINKQPLTTEQQRANKEFREQKQALLNSIRLAESDIEHKQRMIANYKERVAQLDEKIVEEF